MKIAIIGHIPFSKLFTWYGNFSKEKMYWSARSNCRVGNWQGNNNFKNVYPMVSIVVVWCIDLHEILTERKKSHQSRMKVIEPSANIMWKCTKKHEWNFHDNLKRDISLEREKVPLGSKGGNGGIHRAWYRHLVVIKLFLNFSIRLNFQLIENNMDRVITCL